MKCSTLGSILVERRVIDHDQLERAIQEQGDSNSPLGDILTRKGYASEEDIAKALAEQFSIPYFELEDTFKLEREEVALVPESIARKYELIPLRKENSPLITIIMADPVDSEAVDAVRSLTGLEVHKAVSTRDRILTVLNKFYAEEAHIESDLRDITDQEIQELSEISTDASVDSEQLRILANDAPVVRFVNLLLMEAVRDRASDIHIEPADKTVRVRMRIDGRLHELPPPPKSLFQAIITRIKIMSEMDIAERRLPLDGRFRFKVQGRVIDVRVSSLPEVFGEKIVLRILDRQAMMVDMQGIGIEDNILADFQRILKMPNGIILLTGPTGSGKTSTLYSALNFLRSPGTNIQTVEDPVEYQVEGINQMQIRPKIGLDFAQALRSILRQDPDIIMIGEIRDLETAQIAMRAALTGHLVLSTLHTNDASSAFSRLKDIGVEPYLIAATVNLVIAQRLIRLNCDACKESCQPPANLISILRTHCPDAADSSFFRGTGCHVCRETGYMGRNAIMEFLEVTDPIRKLIVQGGSDLEIRQEAMNQGMESLLHNGGIKIKKGLTTPQEVLRVCPVDNLNQTLKEPT